MCKMKLSDDGKELREIRTASIMWYQKKSISENQECRCSMMSAFGAYLTGYIIARGYMSNKS